ncbi:unnamed protein product, partial [Mesorhabditis spiculigera]
MSPFPFRQLTETQRTAIHYHIGFSQKFLLRRVAKEAVSIRDALNVLSGSFSVHHLRSTAEQFLTLLRAERQLVRQPTEPEYRLPDAIHEVLRANIGDNDEVLIYRHSHLCPVRPDRGAGDARRYDRIQVHIAQNRRGRWNLDEEKKKKTCAGETHEWEIMWSSRLSIDA